MLMAILVRGWQKINSSWYYFDANGYMQKDWQEIGGKWYYFSLMMALCIVAE